MMLAKKKSIQLNPQQQKAVDTTEGPVLVLAGAGSGKTRVVTNRIVHLIESGVPSQKILGLTFTNKAAEEMNERIKRETDVHVLICTFHSLGARILRESIDVLGYRRDFTIYDEEDSEKLLASCIEKSALTKKGELKAIRGLISQIKNHLADPMEADTSGLNPYGERHFHEIYAMYQARLKEASALDFDDLLYLSVKLFREYPSVLEMYQDRWHYFLVDEYQDTNNAQYQLIKLLANKTKNICVVGDPDQSIYSWRGATIHNILNFERDYPNATVVTLDQNYRSTSNILQAANAVISLNESRYEKELWSALGDGEKISIIHARDERDEAAFVVHEIFRHQARGISLNDMVIFYRTNFQSRAFEDALLFQGIPYTIVGGISYYHRREVKDVLSILRMAQTGADLVAFARTINLPKRGLGPTTLDRLRHAAMTHAMPILEVCNEIVHDHPQFAEIKISKKQKEGLADYVRSMRYLRSLSQEASLRDVVAAAIYETGYLAVLKEEPQTYEDRKANVDELISKAAEWEQTAVEPTLSAFLSELALKSTLDEVSRHHETLKLMTMHNGKGLEFKITFLVGMEEDLFPHVNSKNNPESLEEERRLCYVGMTRAKEKLYLTCSRMRFMWGMQRFMNPSRFLKEIPEQFLD